MWKISELQMVNEINFLKIDDLKTNIKCFKKGSKRSYGFFKIQFNSILIKDLYVNLAVII